MTTSEELIQIADDLDLYAWAENLGYPSKVADKLREIAEELRDHDE